MLALLRYRENIPALYITLKIIKKQNHFRVLSAMLFYPLDIMRNAFATKFYMNRLLRKLIFTLKVLHSCEINTVLITSSSSLLYYTGIPSNLMITFQACVALLCGFFFKQNKHTDKKRASAN